MGAKKKNHTDGGENNDAGKKDDGTTTVVLKVNMHCDGCASKIIKYLRSIQGVETVKAESDAGKLTLTGKVDPTKLRDNLAEKFKKKVELVSPQPKKEKEKENKDAETNNKPEKKTDEKKPKEKQAVATAVLKVALHCQGCIDKIGKTVLKTKGVQEMSIDKEKEMVTVKGTMDVKALVENLTERLKTKVEVVPPKKDKDNEGGEKEGGGKKKSKGNGGGEGGDNEKDEGLEGKLIEHSMRGYMAPPAAAFGFGGYGYNYGYGPYGGGYNIGGGYNYGPPGPVHPEQFHHFHLMQPAQQPPPPPHQMFSDENPNACSIM